LGGVFGVGDVADVEAPAVAGYLSRRVVGRVSIGGCGGLLG
jgi:hypothetical protein